MASSYPTSQDATTAIGFSPVANVRTGKVTATLGSGVNGTLQVDFDPVSEGYPSSGFIAVQPDDGSQKQLALAYSSRAATGGSPGSFTISSRGLDSTTDRAIAIGERVGMPPFAAHHNDVSGATIALEGKLGTGASTPASSTFLKGTGAGVSAWSALTSAEVTAALNGQLGLGGSPGSSRLYIVSSGDDHIVLQRSGSSQTFSVYVSGGNTMTFNKPTGPVGSNQHGLFGFATVGSLDADNAFWNGLQFAGPIATESGTSRYPITSLYHRAGTATNPTDYELVMALGNMGTLRGSLAFAAPAVDGGQIRLGFGSGNVSEEGVKVARTSSSQVTVSLSPTQVGGGAVLKKMLSATATYDPPSTANGAAWSTTITVTGAAVGDNVMVSHSSVTSGDWNLYGYVSAANTVTVYGRNNTGGTVDLASGTLRATVFQF